MNKNLLSISFIYLMIFLNSFSFGMKINNDETISNKIPTHFISAPNMDQIRLEDQIRDKNGMLYRIGVNSYVNLTTENSGVWTTLENGDKSWQLIIKNPDAEALSFLFSSFKLSVGSQFYVKNKKDELVSDVLTQVDMLEDFQQNVALCFGDELVLTLIDKENVESSKLIMDRVIYNYRATGNPNVSKINESDAACEVNVNCAEGTNYQEEKKGVVRIYVVESGGAGWCSGSLINNLANNCKPYVLTALHCGPAVNVSAANMVSWKFYFNYEAVSCTNPTAVGTLASKYVNSCVRIADSNDNDGTNISKSDFLLVQIGTLANEATTINKIYGFGAYWNGWDANNTASTGGVSIHHPAGDIKKISTYTNSLLSSTWSSTPNTHWRVTWAGTTNGHGVTEGGSSGSPIFTYNGGNSRIVGTLSGGSSYCTATSSPDLYGKLSYHWTSDGSTSLTQLKPYLDPNNTGTLVMNGSSNPCNLVGINENKQHTKFEIYPNPTNDKLFIDLSGIEGQKVTIEIYDMSGKLVQTVLNNSGSILSIDLSGINKGIYQVRILSNELNLNQRILKMD